MSSITFDDNLQFSEVINDDLQASMYYFFQYMNFQYDFEKSCDLFVISNDNNLDSPGAFTIIEMDNKDLACITFNSKEMIMKSLNSRHYHLIKNDLKKFTIIVILHEFGHYFYFLKIFNKLKPKCSLFSFHEQNNEFEDLNILNSEIFADLFAYQHFDLFNNIYDNFK